VPLYTEFYANYDYKPVVASSTRTGALIALHMGEEARKTGTFNYKEARRLALSHGVACAFERARPANSARNLGWTLSPSLSR
jgi:hypothetical protein